MDEGDKLAQELLEFRVEHTRKYPHLPLAFERKLIARVVHYLCEQRRQGQTLEQCSKKLGIAQGRLKGWLYRRAPGPQGLLRALPVTPSLMRSVLVSSERASSIMVCSSTLKRSMRRRFCTKFQASTKAAPTRIAFSAIDA